MLRSLSCLLLGGMVLAAAQFAPAADQESPKLLCPVSGKPANKDQAVAYKGKEVYFCCAGCPSRFKADSKPFAAKAHLQLLQTGQITQVSCPLSGHDLDPEKTVSIQGVKVAFCCGNCVAKVKKSEADQQLALAFKNLEKGYTLQTKCPLSGKAIKAEHAAKYKGKDVYFCCPNCPKAFEKSPEKFAGKLPQLKQDEGE